MLRYLILLLSVSIPACQAQEVAFTIMEKDLIPEGIAYDPVDSKFYISSTYKKKIIEIDRATGMYRDFIREGEDGIAGVIGMHVDAGRRLLWAVTATAGSGMPARNIADDFSYTGVYKYDLTSRKLLKKYVLEKSEDHFLNDLTILQDGTVYVTDTQAKSIYTITPAGDKLELFHSFAEDSYPNGIVHTADEKNLIIAVYKQQPNALLMLKLKEKTHQLVEMPNGESVGADGICLYENTVVAVQPGTPDRIIAQYFFSDPQFTGTPTIKTLVADHARFLQPTTGVVVGDEFYFIANSQLQHFRKLFAEHKGNYPTDQLVDPVIMKLRLK